MSAPQPVHLSTRQLFGGAIQLDLPEDYIDASDLRQVPDNQEVFLSPNSETSLVLEVLAMVEEGPAGQDLWEAVKYHFHSISHDNSSLSSTILSPPPTSPSPSTPTPLPTLTNPYTPPPTFLTGTQRIHKFSHNPTGAPRPGREGDVPDEVWIGVALWRCWVEEEDKVVMDGGGGGGGRVGMRRKKADLVLSVNLNLSSGDGKGEEERARVEEWWLRSVGSLRVDDWNLFGDA